jgi:hypothetical protein
MGIVLPGSEYICFAMGMELPVRAGTGWKIVYRSGSAGKRTGWNHFSTGEIPANSGEKVANF